MKVIPTTSSVNSRDAKLFTIYISFFHQGLMRPGCHLFGPLRKRRHIAPWLGVFCFPLCLPPCKEKMCSDSLYYKFSISCSMYLESYYLATVFQCCTTRYHSLTQSNTFSSHLHQHQAHQRMNQLASYALIINTMRQV